MGGASGGSPCSIQPSCSLQVEEEVRGRDTGSSSNKLNWRTGGHPQVENSKEMAYGSKFRGEKGVKREVITLQTPIFQGLNEERALKENSKNLG